MVEKERSSGVQELITRLRDDGVREGQEEADRLIAEARQSAAGILDQARQEATELLQRAQKEADSFRAAGQEALRLAARDMVLTLKDDIAERFADAMRRLVASHLVDHQFLSQLILQIAGDAVPEKAGQRLELLLPEEAVSVDDLRRNSDQLKNDPLSHVVSNVTRGLMREGVTIGAAAGNAPGITVRMVDDDIEIHLTEKAISELLLRHLLPRFRAMMNDIA